jgi:hypothetical protein
MASQLKKDDTNGIRCLPAETTMGDYWVQFMNSHTMDIVSGRGRTIDEAWQKTVETACCHDASKF